MLKELEEYEKKIDDRLYELGVSNDPELSSLMNYIFMAMKKHIKDEIDFKNELLELDDK